jgi:hypothetical protein
MILMYLMFILSPRCLLHHRTQVVHGALGHGCCREFKHDSCHEGEGNRQKRRYTTYAAVITSATLASVCIYHYVGGIYCNIVYQ